MKDMIRWAALALWSVASASAETQAVRQTLAQWTAQPPVIDGRLDDPAWRQAPELGGFIKVSEPGEPPKAPTYVKMLTDGTALYLGVRCVESRLDKMAVTPKKRDEAVWNDDSLDVALDPGNVRAKLYHLVINSEGVQYDAESQVILPEKVTDELAWNGDWQVKCTRGRGEWFAEYRLPFATFGISPTNGLCLGLNVGRGRVGARREDSTWSPTRSQFVNPTYLGEVYLPGAEGQIVLTQLPRVLAPVRGSAQLELAFANQGPYARQLDWIATLTGAAQAKLRATAAALPAQHTVKFPLPLAIPQPGACTLRLEARDAVTHTLLYQGLRCFQVQPEIEVAEDLYALEYQRAEAKLTLHLPAAAIAGAKVEATLMRSGDNQPLATKTLWAKAASPQPVAFSLRGQRAGNFQIHARLQRNGQTLSTAESRAFPFEPQPTVGFDAHGFLNVEGKPWFPVGLYTIQAREGSHDAVMEEAHQAGFNTTVFYAYTTNTVLPLLDAAARHGLRAFVYPANPFRVREHTATREELIAEIQARKNHPALLGWYLVDEPEGIGVSSVETVRNYYQLVKETDPGHPCALVIMTPEAAANYGHSADIVWIDPYPIPDLPVTYVSESMDGAHQNVAKDKSVWTVPQAFDWNLWKTGHIEKNHRPTPEESRCMTYLALVHGAKGILYWAHTASKYYIRDYPEHWTMIKRLAGELRELSPALLSPNSPRRVQITPLTTPLDVMVKEVAGEVYVIAVNRETQACHARFTLALPAAISRVEVKFENRALSRQGKQWEDDFQPLEVHVYRLKTGK